MKIFLRSSLLVVLFMSCKKEKLPESKADDPEFTFSGEFNGAPISRQAGNDSYFMYSSHEQLDNGIYVYQGELKNMCAGNCDYALTVKINDSKISTDGEPMDPGRALVPGGPYYLSDITRTPSEQIIWMVPERLYAAHESFEWKVTGPDSIPASAAYSLAPTLKLGQTYTVELSFNDNVGGCQTSLKTEYRVGNEIQATFAASTINSTTYKFTPQTTATGVISYLWEFGDNTSTTEREPEHVFPSTLHDTTWLVKLTVTQGQSKSVITRQVGNCNANFVFQPQPLDLSKLFKNVTFELRDASGKLYSSADVVQPSSSFVNVGEVSDYQVNGSGDRTKKVALTFACLLKGPDGTFPFTNGKAVIAVSYK